jgi:hypothetical protein
VILETMTLTKMNVSSVPTRNVRVEGDFADLRRYYRTDFSLWDGDTGGLLRRGHDQPPGDDFLLAAMVPTVAQGAEPRLLGYEDCAVVLAIPMSTNDGPVRVAVAAFATRHPASDENLGETAQLLGLTVAETADWLARQSLWTPDSLLRLGQAVLDKRAAEARAARKNPEAEVPQANAALTYQHVSLLHDLVEHLRISTSEAELGQLALDWLEAYLPAESLALQYASLTASEDSAAAHVGEGSVWLTEGPCPVDSSEFASLARFVGREAAAGPYIANSRVTRRPDWRFPDIHQLVMAPVCEGSHVLGWLAAFNHRQGQEFGMVEACLLRSIGVILGAHCGNQELYRRQAELMANVVRSLISAIDAKDPYTRGHSERVARIAVRLAKQLGWQGEPLQTIYLAGLVHDIGKIGISETLLHKPSGLSDEEYDRIKTHPHVGHRILSELKQLGGVLPAVLHHHERWDGRGYPQGLAHETVPEIARILAVADAYDAMTSDRPYRRGLPVEKVHHILTEGKGTQWDPHVIEAYFQAQDDILRLCSEQRETLPLYPEG